MKDTNFSKSRIPFMGMLYGIAAIVFVAAGCNPTDNEKPSFAFEITKEHDGEQMNAKLNDCFGVAVEECVGCADVWRILKQDTTKIVLTQRTSRDRSCENCDGGSLTRVFVFRCVGTGETELMLGYFDDTLRVDINIE